MNARTPDDNLALALDPDALKTFVDDMWDSEIIPALTQYIAIPAKSPAFDPDWQKNAFIDRVCGSSLPARRPSRPAVRPTRSVA